MIAHSSSNLRTRLTWSVISAPVHVPVPVGRRGISQAYSPYSAEAVLDQAHCIDLRARKSVTVDIVA